MNPKTVAPSRPHIIHVTGANALFVEVPEIPLVSAYLFGCPCSREDSEAQAEQEQAREQGDNRHESRTAALRKRRVLLHALLPLAGLLRRWSNGRFLPGALWRIGVGFARDAVAVLIQAARVAEISPQVRLRRRLERKIRAAYSILHLGSRCQNEHDRDAKRRQIT